MSEFTEQQASVMETVSDHQSKYLEKAISDLKDKYDHTGPSAETSVSAPTGSAYKEKMALEQKQRRQQKQANSSSQQQSDLNILEDGDDEDGDGDGDDEGLRQLREFRKKQLLIEHEQKLENLGKGHGQYREIIQDEFLNEVTSSNHVICHFYHRDFERCKIMDHHLSILAARHVETKFVRIDAEKALFFVEKVIHIINVFVFTEIKRINL